MYGLTVFLYAEKESKSLEWALGCLLTQTAVSENNKLQILVLNAGGDAVKAAVEAADKKKAHPAVELCCLSAAGLSAEESYRIYIDQAEGEAVCFSSPEVCYSDQMLSDVTAVFSQLPSVNRLQLKMRFADIKQGPQAYFKTPASHKQTPLSRYVYRTSYVKECFAGEKGWTGLSRMAEAMCARLDNALCIALKKWLITIALYVDEEDSLENALTNILEQRTDAVLKKFCHSYGVQILVLDPHGTGKSKEIVSRFSEEYEGLRYVDAEELSDYEAYNKALPYIKGVYVNFTAASALYSSRSFEQVEHTIRHKNVSLMALRACYYTEIGQLKRYAVQPKGQSRKMMLDVSPKALHLHFNAYFIESALLRGRQFEEEHHADSVMQLLLRLLCRTKQYYYISSQDYIYSIPREDNTSTFMSQHDAWWYTDAVKKCYIPLLREFTEEGKPAPEYLQTALMYLLFARYNCNLNERTKGVLEGEALEEFFAVSGELLTYISPDNIARKQMRLVACPRVLTYLFVNLRAKALGQRVEIVENGAYFYSRNVSETEQNTAEMRMVSARRAEQLIVSTMNYAEDTITLDARLSVPDFLPQDRFTLHAVMGGRELKVEPTTTYALISCFGQTISDRYVYHITIPVKDVQNATVVFYLKVGDIRTRLQLLFQTAHSKLSNLPGCYWCYTKERVMTCLEDQLCIAPLTKKKHFALERHFLWSNWKMNGHKLYVKKCILLRLLYWLSRPFFRGKRIWVTFDKLYKAGDNGEYIYRYLAKQKDGIRPYYIIKPDSLDYPRMKKDGVRLLKFYTLRSLLTCLNAEAVLTTHANVISYCGFPKKVYPYFVDLFSPEIICIQHGLTTQSIAQFQNRLFDNLKLYCCASPNEIENLKHPSYGFKESQLTLTGLARYDGLVNRDQKNILITPTWRRNIVNSNVAHMQKKHSEFFRNSEYFRLYDRLIHDEELIACAQKNGYRITYLLHPGMSAQIDDFDNTGYVDIIAAYSDVNYEKILTEASLMVTDYSGVQFDFAYMRKPILYYHPNTLPPHYEESEAFRCERDGFGPIIDHHEWLVRELCEYMENGCVTKPEYVARSDKFFAFSDHDNCRRIYETVKAYMDGKQQTNK